MVIYCRTINITQAPLIDSLYFNIYFMGELLIQNMAVKQFGQYITQTRTDVMVIVIILILVNFD